MAGVTLTGFEGLSLQESKAEIEAALRSVFGNGIDLSPQSNFGQLVGILAEREADLWALAEAVYSARIPDLASGVSLDYVAGLTGTVRRPGTPTRVTIYLTGDDTTPVPAGSVIDTTAGNRFTTTEDATLADLDFANQWENLGDGDVVVAGDFYRSDDGGTDRIYRVTTGGDIGTPKEIPTGTGETIAVNDAVLTYVGDGTALASANAESNTLGPVPSTARTITEIATPISGWSSAINLEEGIAGDALETDAALRVRREEELRSTGNASVEAITSAVLAVDGVLSVTVFENVSNVTDPDGVPAHAVEVVVRGGDEDEVAAAIFNAKAAGIRAYGTTEVVVEDSQLIEHTIGFTRPTELTIWVDLVLTVDPRTYPIDGNNQVRAAVKAYGDLQRTGKNVVSMSIGAAALTVPGVLDVTQKFIGTSDPAVAETTIAVSLRQLAVFDLTRIDVLTNSGVP